MRLRDLAAAVGVEFSGDGGVEITAVADPSAAGPAALVPVLEASRVADAEAGPAAALLVPRTAPPTHKPALRAADPRLALAQIIALLHPTPAPAAGIDPEARVAADALIAPEAAVGAFAVVEAGAVIGRRAVIGPGAVIGRGARVGEESIIHARAVVYAAAVVGARVIIHSGAIIGSDGFGYAEAGPLRVKIPHIGTVVIEDDVEIGANTTVDRATLGETRIGAGTKIDNLVQVGHNVRIGRDVVIVAQTGISGSVTIGDGAVLAGQVGVVDHVTIGAGARVLARSMVTKDVPPGAAVSGAPAQLHREALREQAALRRILRPRDSSRSRPEER